MRRIKPGYTLVELLVALGILAIFLTLFIAVVSASFRTVNTVQSRSEAQQKARIALNYIRDRIAQASSFTPGIELHDFYRGRTTLYPNPLVTPCDLNWSPNWTTAGLQSPQSNVDNRIDSFDTGQFGPNQLPWGGAYYFHNIEDPLCLADPVPPIPMTLGSFTTTLNENPDQRYPGNRGIPGINSLYRTELEDMDGNGVFSPIERYLRTLVFEVRSPSSATWGPSTCVAGATGNLGAKVERQIVTLAHTWREKPFWQDDNRNGVVETNEIRNEDFVLYERKTRYFDDPNRNLDVNCDGAVSDADEVARVVEVPLVSDIIDVIFQLIDDRGELIQPCMGACLAPANTQISGRSYTGEFICTIRRQYTGPGGQTDVNSENQGVPFAGAPGWGACRRIDRIRVTVVAGSDSAIRAIRKTLDSSFVPFQVLTGTEPREIGSLDYLGVTPYAHFYQKGSLVILQEEISLNLIGG